MTDGDEDVVPSVVRHGNGEQCGDRPALDDVEVVVDQAPFDVLRASEVRFDPPAELGERAGPAHRSVPAGPGAPDRIATSSVPPAGEAWTANGLVATDLATISPLRTW